MNPQKIIYSICIDDVQNVAKEGLGRVLEKKELDVIVEKIGEYFQWYDAIENCIMSELGIEQEE